MTIRPLRALSTNTSPSEDPGKKPELRWIDPADMVIDEDYQRAIGKIGRRNIQRILSSFSYARFAPVIVTNGPDGKWIIIDGQHRATSALMHPGVGEVPAMIVPDVTPAEAAEIFAAVNGNVTRLTAAQLYRARLKAGDPFMAQIDKACQAASVIVVATRSPHGWQRGETMAVHALAMCLKAYGYDTLVTALQCVTQTGEEGNTGMLRAAIIKALCSVLYDHEHWRDAGGALLDVMDDFDFAEALETAQQASKGPQRPSTVEALRSQIIAYLTKNLTVTEAA